MKICNYVDFVSCDKVNDFDLSGTPLYFPEDKIRILAKKVSHSSEVTNNENGPLCTETVIISLRNTLAAENILPLLAPQGYLICYFQGNHFFIGGKEYPAVITYKTDESTVNITVLAKRPVV